MADYLSAMTDRLVEQIANRSASFQSAYPGGSSFLPTNINGSPFRASNALTLAAEGQARGYTDTRWLPRSQAERLGGRISANEVGVPVQYWQIDKHRATMTTSVVFNAEQVAGLAPYERPVLPIKDRTQSVDAIVNGSRASIHRTDGPPSYDAAADVIRITNRPALDNVARQHQEVIAQLAAWTNHPSRLNIPSRDGPSLVREQFRNAIATMMVSDRLGIGYQGNPDRDFARNVLELVRDRAEIARAAMVGEMVAQEIMKFGGVAKADMTVERMQELARQTLRDKAWASANTNRVGHEAPREAARVVPGLGLR